VVVRAAPRFPVRDDDWACARLSTSRQASLPRETRATKGDPGDNVLAYAHINADGTFDPARSIPQA
jgi:hypothetical protein